MSVKNILENSMSLRTYAKINLSLDVLGLLPDGYHEVEMVMQACDLWDEMEISVKKAYKSGISGIKLTCDRDDIPCDSSNTAWKAAELMLQKACTPLEVKIHIKKRIPSAAGLAGGSSNAAGVLVGLNDLMLLGLSMEELMALGAKVGSDVPFSIMEIMASRGQASACALATGTGTTLKPLPSADLWVVLVKPAAGVSTAGVYKALDAIGDYPHPDTGAVIKWLDLHEKAETHGFAGLSQAMANVLEEVTLKQRPEVAELKAAMAAIEAGIRGSRDVSTTMMSGSGPTVYTLWESQSEAERMQAELSRLLDPEGFEIFCAHTL